jgi:hypothetical protein
LTTLQDSIERVSALLDRTQKSRSLRAARALRRLMGRTTIDTSLLVERPIDEATTEG